MRSRIAVALCALIGLTGMDVVALHAAETTKSLAKSFQVRYAGGSVKYAFHGQPMRLTVEEHKIRLEGHGKSFMEVPPEVSVAADALTEVADRTEAGAKKMRRVGVAWSDGNFVIEAPKAEYPGIMAALQKAMGKEPASGEPPVSRAVPPGLSSYKTLARLLHP